VAERVEKRKPAKPSRSECHDRVLEWTDKVDVLSAQLRKLQAAQNSDRWPDSDIPQGGERALHAWTAGEQKDWQHQIAEGRYRLDRAQAALKSWQEALAEYSSVAA
jgi:hypothetical protein